MAVPLPQLTYLPLAEMPQAPGEIPTAKDIASAAILEHNVRESYRGVYFVPLELWLETDSELVERKNNTDEDFANVIIYKTKLVAASAGGAGVAPVWFGPAIANALQPITNDIRNMKGDIQTMKGDIQTVKGDIQTIKADIRNMKEDIRTMKGDVETLKEDSTKTRRLATRSFNATLGTSLDAVYEIVPFQNGQDPTAPPHNLPPLTSVEAILGLSDRQLDSYLRSYHPDLNNRRVIRDRNERINFIAAAIGTDKIIL
ncbi:hypothetical protein JOM56_007814 [Amanita muscaria]